MVIAPGTTLVDYLVPARSSRTANLVRNALLIIGFSIFTALCAQVSFYLPNDPAVPVTLQTLAALLTGAALGSKRGALAMLVYIGVGAAHVPVFAGWTGGFPLLTGGYLVGFVIAAFVVGWLCERGLDRSFFTSALAMLPGSVIIYLIGATWLGFALHANASTAFAYGVAPFLIGDLLKLIVAALLLPIAWSIVRWTKAEKK